MKKLLSTTAIVLSLSLSPLAYANEENHSSAAHHSEHAKHAPFDIQFLDTMNKHHEDGIKMMQMAVDKSKNEDIRNMAQKGMNDQHNDITEMKKIRDSIDPKASEAVNMGLPGMMHMDMTKLKSASGHEFDHMYLDMMVHHHEGAIKMSDQALNHATNSEVKTKAKEMHDKQKKEVAEMKKMLKS